MKWDVNTDLTNGQMATLGNTWARYVQRANAPIGDLDITKMAIPRSFAHVTAQSGPGGTTSRPQGWMGVSLQGITQPSQ
jgi:hypothetical protein